MAREENSNNQAEPDERGAGPAPPTADPTSFGGKTSIRHRSSSGFDVESERRDADGIEVMEADDGRLGLTNTGKVPSDDWAADTGPTKTPES